MTELFDLVKFRNEFIDSMDELIAPSNIQNKIHKLQFLRDLNVELGYDNILNQQIESYQAVELQINSITNSLPQNIQQIEADIDNLIQKLSDDNEYKKKFSEDLTKRSYKIPDDIENLIGNRISSYCDLRFPAMQIRPKLKKYVDFMVAADPLYLVSLNLELMQDIVSAYPEPYQRRLRLYTVENRTFGELPQAQFGFIFAWDYFNYLALEAIEQYAKEIFNLLRPGGTFMFSYTNCDLLRSVKISEEGWSGYCNSRILKNLAEKIGYQITIFQDLEIDDGIITHISWVELRKPGHLVTTKRIQALAQIVNK